MNKSKIEWCDSTWNPVTGCLHNCTYCYAKKIAKRFGEHKEGQGIIELHWKRENPYPYDFYPTFHKYRLDEPARKTRPRKIFVCSMADLFGDWVPDEWILKVLDACKAAPQHKYLFLTKNPKRYLELEKKRLLLCEDNFWFGTSVTKPDDDFAWFREKKFHWFISMEPLLEGIDITTGSGVILPEWVIIGAETGNRKGKIVPKREWIDNIVSECKQYGIPVFMKNSLRDIMGSDFIQEWPKE